jgi:hypothetical protein
VLAAGQGLAAGAVPARVLALSEGVIKTMLLTKLRAFVAVAVVVTVSVGVVGLAYRTTAAEPSKAAAQPAADDLEALRLEVQSLRMELRATRDRVKALEDEARASKERDAAAPKKDGPTATKPTDGKYRWAVEHYYKLMETPKAADPLAEAEAALKKLRERPDDKQAADVLEQALKRLKERAKPDGQPESPKKP